MASSALSLRSCLLRSAPFIIRISSSIPSHLASFQAAGLPQTNAISLKPNSKPSFFHSVPKVAGGWPPCCIAVFRLQAQGNSTESTTARNVAVQVAHELLNAGHHYLDVRNSLRKIFGQQGPILEHFGQPKGENHVAVGQSTLQGSKLLVHLFHCLKLILQVPLMIKSGDET